MRWLSLSKAAKALGTNGSLARMLTGFRVRAQQQAMAAAVERALAEREQLVVEAGTGVGKTFAYLIPGLLFDGKLIISTGTKNLQDQLYFKDLPLVRQALDVRCRLALLKGRANYLCHYRLELAQTEVSHLDRAELQHVLDWSRGTRSGDLGECEGFSEGSPWRPRITSTPDNCLGTECPYLAECYVAKARREAQEADLVVINHHLLLADMTLKDAGFGELLPTADGIILDEAHQLPEVASLFFDAAISSRQLIELARDSLAEQKRDAADMPDLAERAQALEQRAADFRRQLGDQPQRLAWDALAAQTEVAPALAALGQAMAALREGLDKAAERGKGLATCLRRSEVLDQRLRQFDDPEAHMVRWLEITARGFVLHRTPLDIASAFQRQQSRAECAWVFTSATLAVGEQFTHFQRRLGLTEPTCLQLDSPFDYTHNARLYVPRRIPEPNAPTHTRSLMAEALPLLHANGGRAFLLFTSFRALHEATDLLQQQSSLPLFVQGSCPRTHLLERFRTAGNGILLGTNSFWEGVDVRGSALSLVVIDRLPFAAIGDPVLQAQSNAIAERGGNPFAEQHLPRAVIALKQGVGRLIRDTTDRGLLMIGDRRLLERAYGRVFVNSLPPFPLIRERAEALQFIAEEAMHAAVGH